MRDPYDVLGVKRDAGEGEIKKAFRKLAKTYHPDASGDDPKAKERFAEINTAYEIVGDKDKRRKFDAGEIDAEGKPKFAGFEGFAGGGGPRAQSGNFGGRSAEDILNDVFGEAFSGFARGGAAGGAGPGAGGGWSSARRARSPFAGADFEDVGPGPAPGGAKGSDVVTTAKVRLEDIVGSGKVRVTLPSGKTLDVKIPPGFEPGQPMRLKGQGNPGAPAGDAIVVLVHEPHPLFRPDGPNLRLDLPVGLDEAVLGAKVRVPTLEGPVEVTIPPGSSGGKSLRVRARGLPTKAGGRGDLIVNLRIVLPDGPDGGLEQLMKRWREMKPFDPRGPEFD
ncbi:DnaJ C-terminal domain-containing protein [Methylobrevis pamukkalensis]|uniref:Curved DNA-binding protein n=1 Tax=Methylobrevis pamukkalensis TaxID=1439726 RepID=A0A1E3H0B9_9HYPH|nr:DnaJ C-terminal domain-containing protein [Methylobrevis pamukkalensis]ODN69759.1 Curved DNA-binding protein [Methylobrevis pamukkalensis]